MRSQRRAIVTVAALLAATAASAADYPREVQAILDGAREQCRAAEGSGVDLGLDVVRKVDITGRGDDYIVDLHDARCIGSAGAFCGTGGCDFVIVVRKRDGSFVKVFDDRVRGYEIVPGPPPRTIRFTLHGSYCGGHGNPSCIKTHRVTGRPFEFEQPK